MTDISSYIQSRAELIEQQLNDLIPSYRCPYQHLFEAAQYSLLGGGKRLRPILTLATTEMLNSQIELALIPACALEMIHTYSLIHDDLPCMDNDDYRRGKLTVHRKYSEGHAVLTGDYLLTYAFEVLASHTSLPSEKKIKLITTLAKKSGAEGMIGGQVMDIAYEGKKIPIETLRLLHRHKTGALITAAIEFGGIIANATDLEMMHLRSFGENIGLAFQIVDDILDVTSSHVKHGRKIASDVINEKTTYVTLIGLENSQACAQEFYNQAVKSIKNFPRSSILIGLADYMINRKY